MDARLSAHIQKLVVKLQSSKANERYEACEHLRGAPELTPEAVKALQIALNDPDKDVVESAKSALNIHLPKAEDNHTSGQTPKERDMALTKGSNNLANRSFKLGILALLPFTYVWFFVLMTLTSPDSTWYYVPILFVIGCPIPFLWSLGFGLVSLITGIRAAKRAPISKNAKIGIILGALAIGLDILFIFLVLYGQI